MKKITLSIMTIAVALVMVVAATSAYFTDTKTVSGNTFSTGSVRIGQTWQLPVTVGGLYPGAIKDSGMFAVQYTGDVSGDLWYGLKHTPGFDDLEGVLDIQIERVDSSGAHLEWVYSDWKAVPWPFLNWTKVASNMSNGDWAYYKLYVRMHDNAPNTYQGKTAVNDIVLYAVQAGGEAPAEIPYGGLPSSYEAPPVTP